MGSEAGMSENGKSAAKALEYAEMKNNARAATATEVRSEIFPIGFEFLLWRCRKYTPFEPIIQRKGL